MKFAVPISYKVKQKYNENLDKNKIKKKYILEHECVIFAYNCWNMLNILEDPGKLFELY